MGSGTCLSSLKVYFCKFCNQIDLLSDNQQDWEIIEKNKIYYVHYTRGKKEDSLKEISLGATADRTYTVYQHSQEMGYSQNGKYSMKIECHTMKPGFAQSNHFKKFHSKPEIALK